MAGRAVTRTSWPNEARPSEGTKSSRAHFVSLDKNPHLFVQSEEMVLQRGTLKFLFVVNAVSVVFFLLPVFARAESSSPVFNRLDQEPGGSPTDLWGWTPPNYMRNWEFGINLGDEKTPLYFADLLFPLYRPAAEDQILFVEPRVNHLQGETLFNLGLGYRRLVFDRTWMLGGNVFYDYHTDSHYRVGTGLEAISSYAELRANGYFGLSLARESDPGPSLVIVERPVDGFDVEIGAPIPYYSRLKLFGGYEWYNFRKFENREGWTVRAEYKPLPYVVLDLILSDNTKRTTGWTSNLAFKLPFGHNAPDRVKSPLKMDSVMFPDGDVGDRLLDLVERHHEIVLEKYSSGSGVTIEVGRRN